MNTNKTKPALLVIDIQNFYLKNIPEEHKRAALEKINNYIGLFREYGCPVVSIYHHNAERGAKPGTADFEFPEEILIAPTDAKIIKTYPDGFNKTNLNAVLQEKGCNTLFLCGLSAVGCVLATWMGAFNHDYEAYMIKNAIMSYREDFTANIELMFDAADKETIIEMLKSTV